MSKKQLTAYELFDAEREKYDAQIQELHNEIQTVQREIEALTNDRAEQLEQGASDSVLDSYDSQIEEANKRLRRLKERIPALQRRKQERLRAVLPRVRAYADARRELAMDEYNDAVSRFIEHKAQYLRMIHDVEAAAHAVNVPNAEYRERCEEAGYSGTELPKLPYHECEIRRHYNNYGTMDEGLKTTYTIPEAVIQYMFDYNWMPDWADEVNGGEA